MLKNIKETQSKVRINRVKLSLEELIRKHYDEVLAKIKNHQLN